MSSTVSFGLQQRNPKRPIRKLPKSVAVPADAELDHVKKAIARAAGVADHNRLGLYSAPTGKLLSDRRARVVDESGPIAETLLVKDLGYQVAWRAVFMAEYAGPILAHVLFVRFRAHVFPFLESLVTKPLAREAYAAPLSAVQAASLAMFVAHFVKRELETVFVHRFSLATMPARNILRNSAYYVAGPGLLCAAQIYAPASSAARRDRLSPLDWFGLAFFVAMELCNGVVHWNLRGLRSPGGTERRIPRGLGTGLVTCPNYMFEVLSWLGVAIVSRSWAVPLSTLWGSLYMWSWSKQKERKLREQFPEYKKKRYTMLPGVV